MTRRYHRWVATIFGIFFLWISATGVLSQVGSLVNNGGFEKEGGQRAQPAVPPGFVCPETMTCRPKPASPPKWNVGLLHHLHSGETFGPVGVIISIMCGLSLLFFAISGLTMYIQMFSRRGRVAETKQLRGGKFFWR